MALSQMMWHMNTYNRLLPVSPRHSPTDLQNQTFKISTGLNHWKQSRSLGGTNAALWHGVHSLNPIIGVFHCRGDIVQIDYNPQEIKREDVDFDWRKQSWLNLSKRGRARLVSLLLNFHHKLYYWAWRFEYRLCFDKMRCTPEALSRTLVWMILGRNSPSSISPWLTVLTSESSQLHA